MDDGDGEARRGLDLQTFWLRIIFSDSPAIPIDWSFASIRIYTSSSGYSLASGIEGSAICSQASSNVRISYRGLVARVRIPFLPCRMDLVHSLGTSQSQRLAFIHLNARQVELLQLEWLTVLTEACSNPYHHIMSASPSPFVASSSSPPLSVLSSSHSSSSPSTPKSMLSVVTSSIA